MDPLHVDLVLEPHANVALSRARTGGDQGTVRLYEEGAGWRDADAQGVCRVLKCS